MYWLPQTDVITIRRLPHGGPDQAGAASQPRQPEHGGDHVEVHHTPLLQVVEQAVQGKV